MRSLAPRFTAVLLLTFAATGLLQAGELPVGNPVRAGPPPQAFIWVGHNKRKFTDDELRFIAANYALVVINPTHGGWDPAARNEDATRLKALNPDIRIFTYFSMVHRLKRDTFGRDTFKDQWLLRDDASREIIPFSRTLRLENREVIRVTPGYFVDLSQDAYRRWALDILRGWLETAPFDGVAFDGAIPISHNPQARLQQLMQSVLSPERINAWNDGLKRMLADSRSLGGRKREVIFNGIAELRTEGRNLDLYQYADSALNEDFCIAFRRGERIQVLPADVLARDIELMAAVAARGKKILQKTNYRNETVASQLSIGLEQAARFCYGVFLMGYAPGLHYFKFGMNYSAQDGELTMNAREIALPLGDPMGPFKAADGVWTRRFENGVVYVNPDRQRSRTVRTDRRLVLMNGIEKRGLLERGATMDIPPQDAMFLVESAEIVRQRIPASRQPRPTEAVPAN